jgi:hypothetical protein
MKRESFEARGLSIETWRDHNGRHFNAWKPHVSVYCGSRKDLLRFVQWPPKTPTGDSLRSWLDSLEAADAALPLGQGGNDAGEDLQGPV